jgi:NAD(P)-dependent dehydrogenase (short-subunit alcohol dehydrogenase family)
MSAFKENLLAGKTAFIAGGTSGINLGIAKRFAQLGARVAVAGRNPEKAANAAASIGAGALGLSCDVRDFAATRTVLESIAKQFGALDIVVSGAAGNFVAPVVQPALAKRLRKAEIVDCSPRSAPSFGNQMFRVWPEASSVIEYSLSEQASAPR